MIALNSDEVKGTFDELQQRLMRLCGEFNELTNIGCQTCIFCNIGLGASNGLIEEKMGKEVDWFHFACSANSCPDCIDGRPDSLECGISSEAGTEIRPCRFYKQVPQEVLEQRWNAIFDFLDFYAEWCKVNRI